MPDSIEKIQLDPRIVAELITVPDPKTARTLVVFRPTGKVLAWVSDTALITAPHREDVMRVVAEKLLEMPLDYDDLMKEAKEGQS